jgi:hypothetical protein
MNIVMRFRGQIQQKIIVLGALPAGDFNPAWRRNERSQFRPRSHPLRQSSVKRIARAVCADIKYPPVFMTIAGNGGPPRHFSGADGGSQRLSSVKG